MVMKRSTQRRFEPVEIGRIDSTRAVIEAVPEGMSAYAGAIPVWCRENRIDYEIGLRSTSVLDLYGHWFMRQADDEFCKEFGEPEFVKADGTKEGEKAQAEHARVRRLPTAERMEPEEKRRWRRARVVGEFSYKAESWDKYV